VILRGIAVAASLALKQLSLHKISFCLEFYSQILHFFFLCIYIYRERENKQNNKIFSLPLFAHIQILFVTISAHRILLTGVAFLRPCLDPFPHF
jgi:hypothetical protein